MSAPSFQEFLDGAGLVKAGDSDVIVTALSKVNVVLAKEQVQDALAAMGFDDDDSLSADDMDALSRTLTPDVADDATLVDTMEFSDPQPDSVAEAPADTCRLLLKVFVTDLQSASPRNLLTNMGSLPERVQPVIVTRVDEFLSPDVLGNVVGLSAEDILSLRDEEIAGAFPDIVQKAIDQDQGIYATHSGGRREQLLVLEPLSTEEQEQFRTAWSALSVKKAA